MTVVVGHAQRRTGETLSGAPINEFRRRDAHSWTSSPKCRKPTTARWATKPASARPRRRNVDKPIVHSIDLTVESQCRPTSSEFWRQNSVHLHAPAASTQSLDEHKRHKSEGSQHRASARALDFSKSLAERRAFVGIDL